MCRNAVLRPRHESELLRLPRHSEIVTKIDDGERVRDDVCGGSSDDHVACYAPYIPVRERQVSDGPKWAAPDGCCSFETCQADRRGQCRYPGTVVPFLWLAACVVILVDCGSQSAGAGPLPVAF